MITERGRRKQVSYGRAELERDFGPLTFADLLKSYRLGEELTQAQLARKLKISVQRLCDFEKGRRLPSLGTVYKFAQVLGEMPGTWVLVATQDLYRRENINIKISVAAG